MAYMWKLLYPDEGVVYDPLAPVLEDDPEPDPVDPDDPYPDPVDPDDEPDPPDPDDEPDPPDPDDPYPDPVDPDDEPDPPDPEPEESYCGISLSSRPEGWASSFGYVELDPAIVWEEFVASHGGLEFWAANPTGFLVDLMALITERVIKEDARVWIAGVGALPIQAQWAFVGWARARPYYVHA